MGFAVERNEITKPTQTTNTTHVNQKKIKKKEHSYSDSGLFDRFPRVQFHAVPLTHPVLQLLRLPGKEAMCFVAEELLDASKLPGVSE